MLNPVDGLVVTAGGGGGWAAMPKGSLPGTGGSGLSFTDAILFIETYCLGSFLTGGGGVGIAGESSGAFFLAISRRSAKTSPLGGGPGGGAGIEEAGCRGWENAMKLSDPGELRRSGAACCCGCWNMPTGCCCWNGPCG